MIFCVMLESPDSVYEDYYPILIAYTNSELRKRIDTIQYNSPYHITLIGCWEGTSKDKAVVHELFKEHNIRGEWYKGVPELLEFIEESSKYSREYKKYLEGIS